MEILGIPELRSPIMILAFSGWNDAGEAASAAIEHLASIWPVQAIGEFDTEEFYDYQNNRPIVSVDESFNRSLTWPTTTVRGVSLPNYDRDLILVSGVEPSLKWRSLWLNYLISGKISTSQWLFVWDHYWPMFRTLVQSQ